MITEGWVSWLRLLVAGLRILGDPGRLRHAANVLSALGLLIQAVEGLVTIILQDPVCLAAWDLINRWL